MQNCPEDDEESRGHVLSAEEKQKQFDTKQKHIKEIVGKLFCDILYIRINPVFKPIYKYVYILP